MNKDDRPELASPTLPAPGSDAARDLGCLCPVFDNNYGRGYMGIRGVYVYRGDCPVHRPKDDR